MNFVKKNYKLIIGIVIGAILISGISVYAAGQYLASQVDYNKNGQAKVSDALDDLYNKASNYKYTEQQYQDFGITQYNKAMSEHNYYVNKSFTITANKIDFYDIGFQPSIVFVDVGSGVYAWIIKGENVKHWASGSSSGTNNDGTKIDGTGFYWGNVGGSEATVKLYAIK